LLSGVANIMTTRISALRGGQGRLPQHLAKMLNPRFEHPVDQVTELDDGVEVQFRDPSGTAKSEYFDACVVCCPLPDAFRICTDKRHLLRPLQNRLSYTQCITVAAAFSRKPNSKSFLVQMPTCEDADVALLFLDHNKSVDRAPEDCGLIDCHWETDAALRMMDAPDEEIVARSLQTVFRVFPELQGHLQFTHVTRWRRALPRTSVGVYQLIGEFNAALDSYSRIQFASDYMSEAGQNTAVEFGSRAAKVLNALRIKPRQSAPVRSFGQTLAQR
jgi:oxygen-dependent protoporphyrinogen oxidase